MGWMNMIKNDNSFVCLNCGKTVEKLGYTSRDHCPHCLHSIHVDIVPGDRSNSCKGKLIPVSVESSSKKGYIIVYKCEKCGEIKRNKFAEDDNFDEMLRVQKNNANYSK
ncbi:MAG: RNHCP domain-containing protein [Clostridiales bacterium]|nr:RNHCP domain-containing protein [Clostridiales bacterium]